MSVGQLWARSSGLFAALRCSGAFGLSVPIYPLLPISSGIGSRRVSSLARQKQRLQAQKQGGTAATTTPGAAAGGSTPGPTSASASAAPAAPGAAAPAAAVSGDAVSAKLRAEASRSAHKTYSERRRAANVHSPLLAFVTFADEAAAARASSEVMRLFGIVIHNHACKVEPASAARTLHVSGLEHVSVEGTKALLADVLAGAGFGSLSYENEGEVRSKGASGKSAAAASSAAEGSDAAASTASAVAPPASPAVSCNGEALIEFRSHGDALRAAFLLRGAFLRRDRGSSPLVVGWATKDDWAAASPKRFFF